MEEKFAVDITNLKQIYLDLQKQFHPDYFVIDKQATEFTDKNLIVAVSAHINNAFKTLQNPLSRAILLLKLNNIEYNLAHDTSISEDFLIEQMEIHEEINKATLTNNLNALENIEQQIKIKKNSIIDNITMAFNHIDISLNYEKIKQLIKQLAFYDKLEYLVINSINDIL